MRVLIVSNMELFVRNRTDDLAAELAPALVHHGHESELLRIPFTAEPAERVPSQMLLMRWLELDYVDHVIALTFPAYLIRHARKTVWLLEPHRSSGDSLEGDRIFDVVRSAECEAFAESRAVFAATAAIGGYLGADLGIACEVLTPPTFVVDESGSRDDNGLIVDWSTTIESLLR